MKKAKKRVLVAMSGGVDSSVSAYLLKENGFDTAGLTMCFGIKEAGKKKPTCCGPDTVDDARQVCRAIGIPHYAMDFSGHLEKEIIRKFLSEYLSGRTPNPCVDCNRVLKFGILLKKALSMGFDFLATGHYARIEKEKEGFVLKRARDKVKDQSYFLYSIDRNALRHILFPLGELAKDEVRRIARRIKLAVADKKESQDICFVPEKNYHRFFAERAPDVAAGPVINLEGEILGEHKGAVFYTIGQRSGLGIGYRHPLYVLSKDIAGNKLVVGQKKDLGSNGLVACDVNIFVDELPKNAFAKIRYNQKEAKCRVFLRQEGKKLEVLFEEPEEAVTPGQSVVLYEGDTVLGGGVIEKSFGGD